MDEVEIKITCYGMAPSEVQEVFKEFGRSDDFRLKAPMSNFRMVDPNSLVAILSASSAALAAFITGLLAVAKKVKADKIEIHDIDGRKLIVPPHMPLEKIDQLLERLRKMETPRITITRK